MRTKIILACSNCDSRNYTTHKNKVMQSERFETRKHCKRCNAHTVHRETK